MADSNTAMIHVDAVSFTYKSATRVALDKLTLTVETGDFLGIIGPSGAGKSTLLYCMNGVIPHYYKGDFYGAVSLGGNDTFETSLTDLARIAATVFQDIDAQMVASVMEDEMLFGLENFGVAKEEIASRVTQALEQVGIADLRHRTIASLSGGQKQKVAVAAVLALQPKVLLLDEPTGALDPAGSEQIFTLLRELNAQHNITVVVVEQKIGLLAKYCSKLAVISGGKLRFYGAVREVLRNVDELFAIGVNVPRVTTLSACMAARSYTITDYAINVEEARVMVEQVIA